MSRGRGRPLQPDLPVAMPLQAEPGRTPLPAKRAGRERASVHCLSDGAATPATLCGRTGTATAQRGHYRGVSGITGFWAVPREEAAEVDCAFCCARIGTGRAVRRGGRKGGGGQGAG